MTKQSAIYICETSAENRRCSNTLHQPVNNRENLQNRIKNDCSIFGEHFPKNVIKATKRNPRISKLTAKQQYLVVSARWLVPPSGRIFFSSHIDPSSRSVPPLSIVPTGILCGLKGSWYSVAEFSLHRFTHISLRSRSFPLPPRSPVYPWDFSSHLFSSLLFMLSVWKRIGGSHLFLLSTPLRFSCRRVSHFISHIQRTHIHGG